MKEIDIDQIAALAKLSLNEDEQLRATEEMLDFTQYVKILEAYCDKNKSENTYQPSQPLRKDKVSDRDTGVFQGYVTVPLTVGGEE